MLTNILLGLILGVVITSFIILNNKLFKITNILSTITSILNNESVSVTTTFELFKKLVEQFSEKVSKDNEHWRINEDYYNNIITLLKSRFKDVDNSTDSIYDKLNNIDSDIQTLIVTEHRITRNEIKKLDKISSKKKLQSKTNKSINHKQKCE